MENFDVTIIGAGPVGLYAGFYAGMRGLKVKLIDSMSEVGGQPINLYPEKNIYDIPGFPAIKSSEFIGQLYQQLEHIEHTLCLNESVTEIEKIAEDFIIKTDKDTHYSNAILLTTGAGQITPRKLGLEGEEEYENQGKLAYFIKQIDEYKNKKVAVLGGGDSAVDWALLLNQVADEVSMIHRRDSFRAHEIEVKKLNQSTINQYLSYTIHSLNDRGLMIEDKLTKEQLEIQVDKILVNYGLLTNPLDIVKDLETNRRGRVTVNGQMQSNLVGIYAAGDANDYEGKTGLIALGFGEVILAIQDMIKKMDFGHELRKGHSTSLFEE
ncbi:MAG: NAD(P)/FAD-dependent oxidoreductase [Streptococcaceae bacterium]|nr:NAD(P)/FAD-dependent oxidoreductase [Streptococcaceae bacterium]MCL2681099.1 NAD(P)/FAD-dependent oxidoreductase [Streptococcaceae bacterium]